MYAYFTQHKGNFIKTRVKRVIAKGNIRIRERIIFFGGKVKGCHPLHSAKYDPTFKF